MKTYPFFAVFFVLFTTLFFCIDVVGQNDTTNDSWRFNSNETVLYTNRDTSTTFGHQRVAIGASYAPTDLFINASGPEHGILVQNGRLGFARADNFSTWLGLHRKDGSRLADLEFWTTHTPWQFVSSPKMTLTYNGLLAIGISKEEISNTTRNQYKLAVGGKILAEEIVVDLLQNWPDYVFENTYQLPTLEERAAFYTTHKRLPTFQSAIDMNGLLKIKDIAIRQQETIEQNAIYITQLHEQNKSLKAQNEQMQQEIKEIKKILQTLTK